MKDEMHGNKVNIVDDRLVKRTRIVVSVLQSIDMCGNEGVSWKSSLIQTSLMDLEALLGHILVVSGGSVDGGPSFPSRWSSCLLRWMRTSLSSAEPLQ